MLRQIAHGLNSEEIAAEMNISRDSIMQHVQHIFQKLGVRDRTQAALWAIRNDLV